MLKNLILKLIFPDECLSCREEGELVCSDCFKKLKNNSIPENDYLIKNNLQDIFIAGDYENKLLADLIKKYKYNFLSRLSVVLAKFLLNFWQDPESEKIYPALKLIKKMPKGKIILIPVPLSKKRLRWRGFNQAKILAAELGRYLDYELDLNLIKIKDSPTQASLNEKDRLQNLQNTFYYKIPKNLNNKVIILIDDITTTGATLNEAAMALKKAGALEIYGLVLAKG